MNAFDKYIFDGALLIFVSSIVMIIPNYLFFPGRKVFYSKTFRLSGQNIATAIFLNRILLGFVIWSNKCFIL